MASYLFASLDEEEDWLDREVESIGINQLKVAAKESAIKKSSPKKKRQTSSLHSASPSKVVFSPDETSTEEDFSNCWYNFETPSDERNKPNFNFTPPSENLPHRLSKSEETPLIEIPSPINRYLRDYQRDGVEFLYDHYIRNEGAILADDMGLGKTVQVIAFLSAIKQKTGTNRDLLRMKPAFLRQLDVDEGYGKEVDDEIVDDTLKPSLIVAPACVLCNWIQEFDTWGHFSVGKFHGSSKEDICSKLRRNKLDVVVTTFETFRDCSEILNSFDFDCVIVDEVHKIKEPKSRLTQSLKTLNCKKRFGLTGTPLQNNILEFWCILDWANPFCFGTKEQFKNQFADLIEERQRHRLIKRRLAASKRKVEEFSILRDKYVLRRTKSLIADQLPKKEDFVLFCPITELQSNVFRSILSCDDMILVRQQYEKCACDSKKVKGNCCFKENKNGVKVKSLTLALLSLLLKAANHIGLLVPSKIKRTPNNEVYTDDDIFNIAFKNEPEIKKLSHADSYISLITIENSGKMMILENLLKTFKENEDKVLIFSYSVRLLEILERFLVDRSYKFRKIDGQTKPDLRMKNVTEFNGDPKIFSFLISTKAGGVGLNITGANRVIIFDPNWNPSHDLQAQDRAYRIGQSRNVEVYRFVTVGTIEEIIYLRQVFKQNVSTIAVQSDNCKRLFDKEDVFGFRKLFELRTDSISLTERLLSRYARIQQKFNNCVAVDYKETNGGWINDDDEKDVEEEESFESHPDDDENDLNYVYDPISPDIYSSDDVDERKNDLKKKLGATFVHRNRELIGDDPIEKHIAECADKDVNELHQHSQELAHDFCPPLLKTDFRSKKRTQPVKNSYRFGSTNVIVGCTPPASKKILFSEMAESLNCSTVELANKILSIIAEERRSMLREFYSKKKLPESLLNEIFCPLSSSATTTTANVETDDLCRCPVVKSVAGLSKRLVVEKAFARSSTSTTLGHSWSPPVNEQSNTSSPPVSERSIAAFDSSSRIDLLDSLVDLEFTNIKPFPSSSSSTKLKPISNVNDRPKALESVERIPMLDDLLML